jgi:hypothetical protein
MSRKILILHSMLYSFRFYVKLDIAAVLMYVAFYFWHGVFLNDLNRITFSKGLFLGLAALVYLVISFTLYRTYESKLLEKYILTSYFKRCSKWFYIRICIICFSYCFRYFVYKKHQLYVYCC